VIAVARTFVSLHPIGCLVLGLALGGCGRPPQPEVVVYVAVDRKDAEPLLQRFEQQTGMRVLALYDAEAAKTTGLVTRLIAEARQPRCDVFWNNEFVQTLLLAERGLLESYRSPQAADIPETLRDPDGLWTGVATRRRVIVYNTRLVAVDEVPRTLEDLAAPQWAGRVAIANPQFGTTRTHIAALYAAWGPAETQAWLRRLVDNRIRIVDGNAMVKNLVARADPAASPILVGLTDTDDVRSGQLEGEPIQLIDPDQAGLGTLVMPSTVCLVRGGPNPSAGRKLIDFLVCRDTESALTADGTGYSPVRPSSPSPDSPAPRSLTITYREMLNQLEPSTRWTSEHFHP